MLIVPAWPAPKHIKAYTTLRTAWDDNAPRQFHHTLPLPAEPIWVQQTHSAIALEASEANRNKIADATYTETIHRVCAVLTADCLPILISDTQGRHVAAIHAGWRGLAAGIIEATLRALPISPQHLLAWLGPAIGPEKFEVQEDVYTIFTEDDAESKKAFIPFSKNAWLANIYELARIRLQRFGVTQIYGGDYCTYSDEKYFFSYRRDKEKTRRMASLIWITTEDFL